MDDARTAQRAASSRGSRSSRSQQNTNVAAPSSSANIAATTSPALTDAIESIEINGKTYYSAPPAPAPSLAAGDFAGTAITSPLPTDTSTPFTHHTWEAFTAVNGPSQVSLDWSSHTRLLSDMDLSPEPVAYTASHTPAKVLTDSPFILDTGATCHISPIKSDFKSLRPIVPHPITSIGGARVYATGVGSIELCIASSYKVMLEDILFILTSMIRLISVLCLNHLGGYISSFNFSSY